jgi:hypothetical protein
MKFIYDDGGRSEAGYKGFAGDCVCRAIAIATKQPYQKVYDSLIETKESFRQTKKVRGSHPRNGVNRKIYQTYLEKLGWKWISTMRIGTGCKVHLDENELPKTGAIICRLSKHLTTVINGVIHDTFNPERITIFGDGHTAKRCVYGYFIKA